MKDGKNLISDEDQEDESLNQLLGRAKTPDVGPYFSRRVLREAALIEQRPSAFGALLAGLQGAFSPLWKTPRAAWSGALAAALLCAVSLNLLPKSGHHSERRRRSPEPAPAVATPDEITSQDVDVIENLDDLISSEESHLWTDENNAF